MTPHAHSRPPKLSIDVPAIVGRLDAVSRATTPEQAHAALLDSVSDIPLLVAELSRIWSLHLRLRLRYANLRAAAYAALSADRDGQPEPLAYLADELSGAWPPAGPSTQDTTR